MPQSLRRLRLPFLLAVFGLLADSLHAAEHTVIELWPEGVPGLLPNGTPEYTEDGRVFSVQHPTLTCYPAPAGKANGTGIIICPGGGYVDLGVGNEGGTGGRWLNSLGVSVFVLKYRLREYGQPAPLRDVLRAMRIVRSRAKEFGIDPDRIGIYGASAGGHLAACAGTLYDDPEGKTGSPLDTVSARPDFLILQYPVITMKDPYVHKGSRAALLGRNPAPGLLERYSVELHVTKDTPPTFLVSTLEDKSVPAENALLFFQALRAAGVPAELHIFEKGAHGFSFHPDLGPTSEWPKRAEEWMRFHGWLPAAAAATGDSKSKMEN